MELVGRVDAVALADDAHFLGLGRTVRRTFQQPLDGAMDSLAELATLVINVTRDRHVSSPTSAATAGGDRKAPKS
jgi:hypothetical protein